MEPLLIARNLRASGRQGSIFGPLDLTLEPGHMCSINGAAGSGKSSLLLALSGRFRRVQGELIIAGIDAIAQPYRAMQQTAVARLGEYVAPEDRLTIEESIHERCFLDGLNRRQAQRRVREIEELVGFSMDQGVELERLSAIERAVASVALVMLRPAAVVVIDDADLMVPRAQLPTLYELLQRLCHLDGSCLVAATVDTEALPAGAVSVTLSEHTTEAVRSLAVNVVTVEPDQSDDGCDD